MVHSFPWNGRRHYGPNSAWERTASNRTAPATSRAPSYPQSECDNASACRLAVSGSRVRLSPTKGNAYPILEPLSTCQCRPAVFRQTRKRPKLPIRRACQPVESLHCGCPAGPPCCRLLEVMQETLNFQTAMQINMGDNPKRRIPSRERRHHFDQIGQRFGFA